MSYRDVLRGSLLFWLAVPISIAVLLGNYHAGAGRLLSTPLSILYWVGFLILGWLLFEIGTFCVRLVSDFIELPHIVNLIVGPIVALLFAKPVARFYYDQWVPFFPPGTTWMPRPVSPNFFENLTLLISSNLALIMIWVVTNLCFNYFRVPRFQPSNTPLWTSRAPANDDDAIVEQTAAAPARTNAELPLFLRHLPDLKPSDILVLEAEDHYTRVHTHSGSVLVPGRFRDAVAQCGGLDGLRVHRSFWVARDAIHECWTDKGAIQLATHNGMKIPVSRSHYALVKAAIEKHDVRLRAAS